MPSDLKAGMLESFIHKDEFLTRSKLGAEEGKLKQI